MTLSRFRNSRRSLIALSGAMALSLAACGGGDDEINVTCGEGTVEEDGSCVVAEPTACGEGTVENDEGLCVVVEPTTCGEGTTRADDGSCVPAEDACTAGTVLNIESGRCVPTADVCEEGTLWSEDAQRCAPEARCQPGDIILDGLCFSEAEQLARDADVTLDAEGKVGEESGVMLELVEGERQIVAGTLGAPVLDADGVPVPVKPAISFEGQFGDLVHVSVHDLGLPDAAFRVIGPRGYERFSGNLGQGVNARQLFLTEEGTYTVQIIPGALSGDEERSNAYGGTDWRYVATFEHQGQAEPTALSDDQAYTIDLSQPGQNYFVVDAGVDAEAIELELEHIPENYELIAYFDSQLLESNPQFLLQLAGMEGSIGISLREVFPPAGAHLPMANAIMQDGAIILDWYHRTPGGDEAQVRLNTPISVPAGDSITREVTVKAGEIFAGSFSRGMGGFFGATIATNPGALDMEIRDEADDVIFSREGTSGVDDNDETFPGYFFERAAADTTFTVTLTNPDAENDVENIMWRLRRQQARQLGDMVGGRMRQIAYDQFMPPGYHIFTEFSADFDWIGQLFFNLGGESIEPEVMAQLFNVYDRFLTPTEDVFIGDAYGSNVSLTGLEGDYIFSFTLGNQSSFGNLASLQILLVEALALAPGETLETSYEAQANELVNVTSQSSIGSSALNLTVTNPGGVEIYNGPMNSSLRLLLEEAGTYTFSYALSGEERGWFLSEPTVLSLGTVPMVTLNDIDLPETVALERSANLWAGPNAAFVAVRVDEALPASSYPLIFTSATSGDPAQPVFNGLNVNRANSVDDPYVGYISFYGSVLTGSVLAQPGLYIVEANFNGAFPDTTSGDLTISLGTNL
ncbi:hypothetical protein FRC96_21300 [Lujinxingia vulgaris]|uniref:Uncharacterized protein n=1 Tax=Lujinxingia vulgaris TaxID=2600176 RepID=A0A5C6WYW3_9DELT|nr:hypothetical protein [Lujinxingia vulgaris]TXD31399.1 hypothetical protein FRC96_21300 [Lujinxingia vulgaris]